MPMKLAHLCQHVGTAQTPPEEGPWPSVAVCRSPAGHPRGCSHKCFDALHLSEIQKQLLYPGKMSLHGHVTPEHVYFVAPRLWPSRLYHYVLRAVGAQAEVFLF